MRAFKRYLQVAVLTIFFALVLTGFVSINKTAQAEAPAAPERFYTSIRIEPGDTLWEIASAYKWEDESIQDYIDEVMEMNHLTSDRITAGQYLMIYYYENLAR